MYILIIDDDRFANQLLQFVLSKEGYEVETSTNPRSAILMIQKREPDLLLLNVSMPYINGFEFAALLHEKGFETPFIFETAHDSLEEILHGFELGADDYISKPYNHIDLTRRVSAVIRRIRKVETNSIRCGRIEMLPVELKIMIPGHAPILLTPTEMQVLRVLMVSSGQIVQRDRLLAEVWKDTESSSNIVDVYIRRLRLKLEEDAHRPQRIISIRGTGYQFLGE